jgi:hypothetical protein
MLLHGRSSSSCVSAHGRSVLGPLRQVSQPPPGQIGACGMHFLHGGRSEQITLEGSLAPVLQLDLLNPPMKVLYPREPHLPEVRADTGPLALTPKIGRSRARSEQCQKMTLCTPAGRLRPLETCAGREESRRGFCSAMKPVLHPSRFDKRSSPSFAAPADSRRLRG